MKKIEKLLLKAYRMGQDSVTYMKVIPKGNLKPTICFCDEDKPCTCKHKVETTTKEDEMLKEILTT